ncbi:MAG: TetR/AcrR family transcriptional regulator [Pseudomonadota bacterium]
MPMVVKPNISRRGAPHQDRSHKTLDRILNAAGELLEQVGFEQLSTNAICKQAGVTPPALYRYFPNKYAVLKELGERLMTDQNALLQDWPSAVDDLRQIELEIVHLLTETIRVTRATRGGVWIMRALHATPSLSDVRVKSHQSVARQMTGRLVRARPNLDEAQAYQRIRLGVEWGYALIEMVFDEPDLDERTLIHQAAALLTDNIRTLMPDAPGSAQSLA